MSPSVERRKYLVHIEFNPCAIERLQNAVPFVQRILLEIGKETPAVAYRSVSGDQCGWFTTSALKAAQIVAAIETPQRGYIDFKEGNMVAPMLTNKDNIVVIELGADYCFRGRTTAGAWFQHR